MAQESTLTLDGNTLYHCQTPLLVCQDEHEARTALAAAQALQQHLQPLPKGIYPRGRRFLVSYPVYKGYFNTLEEAKAAQNG